MKRKMMAFVLTGIFLLLFARVNVVNAESIQSGFVTTSMPEDSVDRFLASTQLSVSETQVNGKMITSFDISESGWIALGLHGSPEKIICVYDEQGDFQYAYTFTCYGDFGVEWMGDNLAICLVRSDVIAVFDRDANCVEMAQIDTASSENSINNYAYWRNEIFSDRREVNGNVYTLESSLGFFRVANSMLKVTYSDGTARILYDASDYEIAGIIFWILLLSAVVTAVVFSVFKAAKRCKSNSGNGQS